MYRYQKDQGQRHDLESAMASGQTWESERWGCESGAPQWGPGHISLLSQLKQFTEQTV